MPLARILSSLRERTAREQRGRRWEGPMLERVRSLALCNMIRAHHGEAGLCGPAASCHHMETLDRAIGE